MKALKNTVLVVTELINNLGVVLEDKKIKFAEIVYLLPVLTKIPKVALEFNEAINELKNGISNEYFTEIKLSVESLLKLQDNKAEKITEIAINWIVYTSGQIIELSEILKK